MGLQLNCPLCCSETFSCRDSLKCHLLSVMDNLNCTSCQKKFSNVFELAMHLSRQCIDEDKEADVPKSKSDLNIHVQQQHVEMDTHTESDNNCTTEIEYVEGHSPDMESELEVPACVLDDSASEDEYYCSTCDTNFTSVEEHVKKFHLGEEVVLAQEEKAPCSTLDSKERDETAEEKDNANLPPGSSKSARILNTVKEEDCIDKEGRLYVRKVVKIEKFWDDKAVSNNCTKDAKSSQQLDNKDLIEKYLPTSEGKVLEIFECSKCEMKFLTIGRYRKHKCYSNYKICGICNGNFINMKSLKAHIKTHNKKPAEINKTAGVLFVCEVCNTNFSTSKSLRLHRRMHEPIKDMDIEAPATYNQHGEYVGESEMPREMFLCQICNKSYDKEYEEAHNEFHNKESNANCKICNRKFHTQENLDMHMHAHAEIQKFFCSNCKKTFLTEEKLEAHKEDECTKRQYECQYCGRRFIRPHEKVKHERIHTGEKPYICGVCGKTFRVSYCLTLHMRTHSGMRPYHCEICEKRFKAHSVYAHHLLTHSNDRKYKCPFCPKMFKTSVQLAGHKNSHTKPFNCTECNRPFASLYAVRIHMETHQRQNNLRFNCWFCGASYARAFALRDHFKEQHIGEFENGAEIDNLVIDSFKITQEVLDNDLCDSENVSKPEIEMSADSS